VANADETILLGDNIDAINKPRFLIEAGNKHTENCV
jgi:hypothetical protein